MEHIMEVRVYFEYGITIMAWLKDAKREEETQRALVVVHSIVLYVGKCSTNCPKLSNEKGVRGRNLCLSLGCWFTLLLRYGILSVDKVASAGSSEEKKRLKGKMIADWMQNRKRGFSKMKQNSPESVLESPRHIFQVTHPSCSRSLSALCLLTPLVRSYFSRWISA